MTSRYLNWAQVAEVESIILRSHADLIATWLTRGDPVGVAQLVRSMRAAIRAVDERRAEPHPAVAR
jgi:hypothetical protein